MSYDLSFSKPNKTKFTREEIIDLLEDISLSFPSAKLEAREVNFEFAQVLLSDNAIVLSLPFWKENLTRHKEINALISVLFSEDYHCYDTQIEQHYSDFDPTIFDHFVTAAQGVLQLPESNYLCADIRCRVLGIKSFIEVLTKFKQVLTPEAERALVVNKDYHRLFLYNLKFAYAVARKFQFLWIKQEDMIDASIDGFEKGLAKYLEENHQFKVVDYIVWWCQQSCLEHLLRQIWEITANKGFKFYSKKDSTVVFEKWKNGSTRIQEEVLINHTFLFKELEITYDKTLSEQDKKTAVRNTLNQQSALAALELEQYQTYKKELEIEDFLLLECSLILERDNTIKEH